ncbi:hypothetical protein, partial [Bifidobacterium sp.]|uniref:hypothetical protein n=1 Tax=Bifidobacterium sp. TaxID=41200 RepID=UPI002852F17E
FDCSTAYVCNLAVAVILSVGKLQNGDRKAAVAVTDTAMGPENQKGYEKWEPELIIHDMKWYFSTSTGR